MQQSFPHRVASRPNFSAIHVQYVLTLLTMRAKFFSKKKTSRDLNPESSSALVAWRCFSWITVAQRYEQICAYPTGEIAKPKPVFLVSYCDNIESSGIRMLWQCGEWKGVDARFPHKVPHVARNKKYVMSLYNTIR